MPFHVRSTYNDSGRSIRSRRGTFETLEARLTLSANLGFAGAFEILGGPAAEINSSSGPLEGRGGGMVTDAAGNRYLTVNGTFDHTIDLDPGPAVQSVTMDASVVKLAPSGAVLWSAALNATGGSFPLVRINHAVDAEQNVFVVGDFRGTVDFDPGPGVTNITSSQAGAEYSVYFAKLNSAGSLQWVRTIDGAGVSPNRIMVDNQGNLVIATNFGTPMDVDTGPGQFLIQQKSVSGQDLLALKYGPNGDFIWARQIGGVDAVQNSVPSLAVDSQGDVYLGRGFTGSLDLDPGAGVHLATNANESTAGFVVRLSPAGDFKWAYVTEGAGSAQFRDLEVGDDGSVVMSGYFNGTVDFQPGSGTLALTADGTSNAANGLVVKLNGDSSVAWARKFGGLGSTQAVEVDIDDQGDIYLGGWFGSSSSAGQAADFDPGPGINELIRPSTNEAAFVLSLTDAGDFRWAVPLGGNTGRARVQGLSVSPNGDVQLSGGFRGTGDFDPSLTGETWLTSNGGHQTAFTATLTQSVPNPDAPVVDAGAAQTIAINSAASLHGTVTDDGLPNPVTTAWSLVSGPGTVALGNASALDTTATFSTLGSYVLKLEATDGQYTTTDYVNILVNPLTTSLTAAADTYLDGKKTTTNYGAGASLIVNGNPDNAALLKWDLSGIPAGSSLQSATLSINVTGASVDTYEIYELKRSWTESQATWNKSNSATNWQSAGAQGSLDRGTTVLSTVTASAAGVRTVVLNAAGLAVVQGWVNNPATNFGFVLQDYANTVKDDLAFSSREATMAANRPLLQLIYSPPSLPQGAASQFAATADMAAGTLAVRFASPNAAAPRAAAPLVVGLAPATTAPVRDQAFARLGQRSGFAPATRPTLDAPADAVETLLAIASLDVALAAAL